MQKITKTPHNTTQTLAADELSIGEVYIVLSTPQASSVKIGSVAIKAYDQVIFLDEQLWGSGKSYTYRKLNPGEKITIENIEGV